MKATDWKLGTSSWFLGDAEVICEKDFETAKKGGVDCIELTHGMIWQPDLKKYRKFADNTGIDLWSFHTPYGPFEENDIASLDKDLREKTIALHTDYLHQMAEAGIDKMVIHPSGEPNADNERVEKLKCAKDSLSRLADEAEKFGIVLAVEDIPRSCIGNGIDEMTQLVEDDDRLKICFDTNHLLFDDNVEFIKKLGSKIITLHVSDYDFVDEKHWLPYEGKNDWVGIVTALEDAGYEGPWMYEIGSGQPRVFTRSRDLVIKDLYDNYQALINKVKAPTVK